MGNPVGFIVAHFGLWAGGQRLLKKSNEQAEACSTGLPSGWSCIGGTDFSLCFWEESLCQPAAAWQARRHGGGL